MQKFHFITHDITDAKFNIASEEYLLRQKQDYYIYIWVNAPAVIIGVNQNAIEEVNLDYTNSHGINVVRRITGGGAVYHDKGNICYTVIAPYDSEQDNYRKFTDPVIKYLNSLGVNATFSGRNDITIDSKKISGNAQTVFNDRIMHHGTLLFDTDGEVLSRALKPNKLKMQSKGIKSIRARVTNIRECLPNDLTANEFKDGLCKELSKDCLHYQFTQEDLDAINQLITQKYNTYEWNIGKSPKGNNLFEKKFDFGVISINFDTEQGVMQNVNIHGDFFTKKDLNELAQKLNGTRFERNAVLKKLSDIDEYIVGANAEQIVNAFFES